LYATEFLHARRKEPQGFAGCFSGFAAVRFLYDFDVYPMTSIALRYALALITLSFLGLADIYGGAQDTSTLPAPDTKEQSDAFVVRARWMVGLTKNTCIQVDKDGHFRLEKVIGFPGSDQTDVYESTLSRMQMNDLLAIIRQKDFAGLHTLPNRPGFQVITSDGQIVSAEVRREDQTQEFQLVDEEGKTALPSAVMPFLKWMKDLKPEKSSRIKNAKPSMCVMGRPSDLPR
jgi:hypothetical protein